MFIYLVTRKDEARYDEWEAVVVVSEDLASACSVHPGSKSDDVELPSYWTPENLKVHSLGTAAAWMKKGCVLSSFNAG